ncbi:MAG: protoglobin domain-containing protein [Myxococcota bacterium]|nr:protoglobin domain-containing protein [Myxococcota bacterium]
MSTRFFRIDSAVEGTSVVNEMGELSDLEALLRFFDYGKTDREVLRELKPLLEQHADAMVEAFYHHLQAFPQTRKLLRDPEVVERLLQKQRDYLLSLAGPIVDESYVAERARVGTMHERVGLEPSWYMGAYSLYLGFLVPLICEFYDGDVARGQRAVGALQKLLLFDAQVAMTQYQERHEEELENVNQDLAQTGRRLALDLERTGAELQRISERAKEAERLASIGILVAGLAHEIGTPMGVIQGHAKLLERVVDGEDGRWRLQTIQEQIGRISRIMQSLLNMARPARSRKTTVDLSGLIQGTLAFLAEKLSSHAIEVHCSESACPSIVGDSERLQQLLLNLILNAVDAMDDGGRLELRLGVEGAFATIRIADSGPGIKKEELGTIFQPFFTTKEAGEGHGLGLAVAHGIASEHGGELSVEATGPNGTTFLLELPLEPLVPAEELSED